MEVGAAALFEPTAPLRVARELDELLDVRPETATVIRNGSTLVEAPQRVQVGETIEVKAGERVPLDGTMLDEVAAFNTSALTGESVPRNIRQGGEVLAGMIAYIGTGAECLRAQSAGRTFHP